jgi:hypothetical protein
VLGARSERQADEEAERTEERDAFVALEACSWGGQQRELSAFLQWGQRALTRRLSPLAGQVAHPPLLSASVSSYMRENSHWL